MGGATSYVVNIYDSFSAEGFDVFRGKSLNESKKNLNNNGQERCR